MKLIFTVLILAIGLGVSAQPVVLSQKEVTKALRQKLGEDYKNPYDSPIETPFSIQHAFQEIYAKMLDKERAKELTFWNMLYLNAEGKIDYLVFDIGNQSYRIVNGKQEEPRGADSVAAIIKEKITPYLTSLVSRRTAGARATLTAFVSLQERGAAQETMKKDSVVRGLAEAVALRDTLKIKSLILNQSLLTAVPDVIYRFPNLEQLFLADNDIDTAHFDMARLPKLRDLDLSKNNFTQNSITISRNKSLRLLNMQKTLVTDIPNAARSCKRLESLWLGNNRLSALNNASFKGLKHLKDVNLYKAEMGVLPSGIRKMRRLQVLDLYYNKLETLPKSITKLKRLTHLAVSYNQLSTLPTRMDRMKRVHTIYAHHNHLSKLPERITRMQSLRIVDLGFNWLTTFPSQLVAFTNLEELDLSANNFPDFPMQLLQIRKLDKLHLRGNPFLGEDAERKYSEQLSQLKKKNIEVFY